MEKEYRKIKFCLGQSIETAVKELKSYEELVCGSFNGKMLYSDVDDVDSAYVKIIGKTKTEHDAELELENERYEELKRKHKESIPELTKEWIEKGKQVLDKKYLKTWKKCVPIRLDDLYQGFELGACLEIAKALNAGCGLETAKIIIENQGHSGMSFNLVCSMVKSFCDRGSEFVTYVKS